MMGSEYSVVHNGGLQTFLWAYRGIVGLVVHLVRVYPTRAGVECIASNSARVRNLFTPHVRGE